MCRCVQSFAQAQEDQESLHMAWVLLSKSMAHAIDYDARLCPSGALLLLLLLLLL